MNLPKGNGASNDRWAWAGDSGMDLGIGRIARNRFLRSHAFRWALALLLLGGMTVGALWTAAAEIRPRPLQGGPTTLPSPQLEPPPTATPSVSSPTARPPSPSPIFSPSPTLRALPTPVEATPTATPSPTPTPCRPPRDWVPYWVQPGDTAFRLASETGISLSRFLEANCLRRPALFIGQRVYLPVPLPTPTPNPTPCGPPPDWVPYTVQPGETLYRLAARFQVPLDQLMHANCLTRPAIRSGQHLYVPPVLPTATPSPTPALTPTGTPNGG